jgi:ribonuclease VapC
LSVTTRKDCPIDAQQAQAARAALVKYGRGRRPAKLTLGDCFSYALARTIGEPLLFKSKDFSKTDIKRG